ncbi:MAG: pilus assembly protein PilM, partial [Candidatus Pacebacteria bacterium]|nr:pilus assembly protein PilM [Candidatus Paceibacterota bacterium]
RWKIEERERKLEQRKWKLEEKLEQKRKELKEIEEKLKKQKKLEEKIEKINKEIEILKKETKNLKERLRKREDLEKEFQEAWKEYLKGNVDLAIEKLKEIQKKLSQTLPENEKKEIVVQIEKEEEKRFFKPLEEYKKGRVDLAVTSLGKLLEKIEEKPRVVKEEKSKVEEKKIETREEKPKVEGGKILTEKKPRVEKKELEIKEKPSLVIIKEKEAKEKELEEFKKKLEEEREKFLEEERKKLQELREEFERRQKELIEAIVKGKVLGLKEKQLREFQKEILQKELEIEKKLEEKLKTHKEELARKKEELAKAESALSSPYLTEGERIQRERIIKFLREKIEKERQKLENKELAEIKERQFSKERKLVVLQDAFEQALSFYKERELEKARRTLDIIKEQLEQAHKLGLFVNLESIPIYTNSVYLLQKLDREIKEEKVEEKKKEVVQSKELEKKKRRKKIWSWKAFLFPSFSLRGILKSLGEILFPLPTIGLDLSDYSIELVRLNKSKEIITLVRQVLKPGVLVDGKVKDPRAFSSTLSLLLKNAGFGTFQPKKGSLVKAVVSLPNSAVYTFVFQLKYSQNLFKEVEGELEKVLPLSLEEIYWDYVVSGQEGVDKIKVMCVAAERDVVDTLVYFLRTNGIDPVALDVGVFSIGRVLSSQLIKGQKTGVLDIGTFLTTFNVFNENGFVDFATSMPYAGYNFQIRIANFFKISLEQAEKVVIEQGLMKEPVGDILKEEVKKLINEIKEALKYYQETTKSEVKKIIVIGGCASLPGLIRFLSENLSPTRIEVGNPFLKTKLKKSISPKESLLFIEALGLAQRAISKNPVREGINLLPEEIKRKEREVYFSFIRKRVLVIRILIALVLVIVFSIILYLLFK